jgi:hypothetical protein
VMAECSSIAKSFAGAEPKTFVLEKFGGLNTKANRPAIGDQEFSWLENLMPIGDGNMRCLPTNGPVLYTASGGLTIIYFYCYNINSNVYAALFLSDGSAVQVNLATLVATTIAGAGTFYPGATILGNPAPQASQWGTSGIAIVSTNSTSSYYAWDGAVLYGPGSAAPSWLTDSTPTTMPTGVSGTCIETYQGRAWIGNGVNFTNSAPGNGADFTANDGGGTSPVTDAFLRREITWIRQSNSFLYRGGDSSVNVISNVQSSGSPVVTTYNNQNVDPQVGSPFHNSVAPFGRALIFATSTGVYRLEGGSVEKISDDALDGVLSKVQSLITNDASINQPTAAVCNIYAVKTYCVLIPVLDIYGVNRLVMAMWSGGKKWWFGSQDRALTFIGSQEINSICTAYGTDGTHFFQLFATTSMTLTKILQSKLWAGDGLIVTKQVMRAYALLQDNSGAGYTLTGTIDYVAENATSSVPITISSNQQPLVFVGTGPIQFTGLGGANLNFTVSGLTYNGQTLAVSGAMVGWTLTSTSPDFTLEGLILLYRNQSPFGA